MRAENNWLVPVLKNNAIFETTFRLSNMINCLLQNHNTKHKCGKTEFVLMLKLNNLRVIYLPIIYFSEFTRPQKMVLMEIALKRDANIV